MNFPKSVAALAIWDEGDARRYAALDECTTDEAFEAWKSDERAEIVLVLTAFWEDTKDRNSLNTILASMHVEDVRKMIGK